MLIGWYVLSTSFLLLALTMLSVVCEILISSFNKDLWNLSEDCIVRESYFGGALIFTELEVKIYFLAPLESQILNTLYLQLIASLSEGKRCFIKISK